VSDQTPSDETPSEPPRQPLDYIAAHSDDLARRERRIATAYGAILSGVAVFLGVFVFILGSLNFGGGPGPRGAEQLQYGLWVGGIMVAAVGIVTVYQHFVRRRNGFLAGVLTGIGIAALIEGACFVAMSR
jgi:formate hydrogenlyase subunit 3/multisubunit Na+/H+ antiporter MnhD subunit